MSIVEKTESFNSKVDMTLKSQNTDRISMKQGDQLDDDRTIHRLDNFKKWTNTMFGDIYAEDDPKQLSTSQKYVYVFVVALLGINATITILIYMPGIYDMMKDLNTSIAGVDATMAIYIAFTGIAVTVDHLPFITLYLSFCIHSHCFGPA